MGYGVLYGWKDRPLGSKVWYSIELMVQWKRVNFREKNIFGGQVSPKIIKVVKGESVVSEYAGHHRTHIIFTTSEQKKYDYLYVVCIN